MADKKLNEVPVVSDIVTIFGKRSNGEIVQIDKSNLATLLGELMFPKWQVQLATAKLAICLKNSSFGVEKPSFLRGLIFSFRPTLRT